MNLLQKRDTAVREYMKEHDSMPEWNELPDMWRLILQKLIKQCFEDGFNEGIASMEQPHS